MDGTRHWIAPAALGAATIALVLAAYAAGRANAPTAAASEPAAACDCLTSTDVLTAVRGLEHEVAILRGRVEGSALPSTVDGGGPESTALQGAAAEPPAASIDEVLAAMDTSLGHRAPDLRACLERSGTREAAPEEPVRALFELESTGKILEVRLDASPLSEAAQRCILQLLTKEPPVSSAVRLPGRMSVRRELPLSE